MGEKRPVRTHQVVIHTIQYTYTTLLTQIKKDIYSFPINLCVRKNQEGKKGWVNGVGAGTAE